MELADEDVHIEVDGFMPVKILRHPYLCRRLTHDAPKRDDVGSLQRHQAPVSAALIKGCIPFQRWNPNHASRRFHQLR